MGKQLNVNIPTPFLHPLFFKESGQEFELHDESLETLVDLPFIYDIAHCLSIETNKPWEEREQTVAYLLSRWFESKNLLRELFGNRRRNEAKPIMSTNIAAFIMALNWTNKKPVTTLTNWKDALGTLEIKPVNCLERLEYIINSPDHYHSYLQLVELFEELNKQYQLSIMKEKSSLRT
ncbi:hypothetical protein JOC85_002062 [Bacillus mesophilus]|uniref:YpoC-like domain-containing protein n=1 Tax=Bacillus mesophilus TaxID=1808955 RepID=A0A6M0Q473_9BACI|nr:hypothetical protein [Bacillus mesophilus]MBM7661290.1 hypothetical protein [Bacillus mesophilus]NEY71187.1 hypothetical protein [Bacillus mesophilus]